MARRVALLTGGLLGKKCVASICLSESLCALTLQRMNLPLCPRRASQYTHFKHLLDPRRLIAWGDTNFILRESDAGRPAPPLQHTADAAAACGVIQPRAGSGTADALQTAAALRIDPLLIRIAVRDRSSDPGTAADDADASVAAAIALRSAALDATAPPVEAGVGYPASYPLDWDVAVRDTFSTYSTPPGVALQVSCNSV